MRALVAAGAALVLLASPAVRATGFTDVGDDIEAADEAGFELDGYLRTRGELLWNLDLDRGPTPSGALYFPVPLDDPTGQLLTHADLRFRADLFGVVPDWGIAAKLRVDVLDNLTLGSAPLGPPGTSSSQGSPASAIVVRRAYGEVLLPFGLLAAGRMGAHWGLGMLSNGGDCADCDSGDSSDRIAFVTPLAGHIWALAYDFSASGPFTTRTDERRVVDVDPTDDVRTISFAVLSWETEQARERRRRAERATFEYGLLASYRWQENDVPASYLPLATDVPLDGAQVMHRGLSAFAGDLWFRLTLPSFRVELEAAVLWSKIEQPSLVPGVYLREPVESLQFGVALESEYEALGGDFGVGLDAGFASGDATPGFGAFPTLDDAEPQPGELQGAQAVPPWDNRADNFRFHPDYRVDRILFREIIGTVTDAFYFRPHLRWRAVRLGDGGLDLGLAALAAFAVQVASTPGGALPLGIELDPTVAYVHGGGFTAALEYALLVPLDGLDNPALGLGAQPAQSLRLRLMYRF